jgi:sugar phosphate isomerase/epimerase
MSTPTRREFLKQAAGMASLLPVASMCDPARAAEATGWQTRFAICNETFEDWPHEKVVDFVADCGYTGLEIAPFTFATYVTDISAARRTTLRSQAERAGLKILGLHWLLAKTEGLHLTTPDADVRRKTADYLGELARFCADLGGEVLVLGSPKQRNLLPGVTRQQAFDNAAEVLGRMLPVLEKTGVRVAIEPLAPAETNFLTHAAEALELVRRMDVPQIQLLLDCKAMAGGEQQPIPEVIRRHHAAMIHFHANDPNLQGPGFGDLNFVPVFQALKDVAYRGWISVEVFDYTPGAERLARESLSYMRQCAKEVT